MSAQVSSSPTRGQAPLLRWALVVVLALSGCWALASPLGSIPDEPTHVIYAGAVARGQIGTGPHGDTVRVPEVVAHAPATTCAAFRSDVTADCVLPVTGSMRLATVDTGAGHYPPLYYALVGWPTWFGFGDGVWYLMRLLSVALAGLLLWCGVRAWRRDSPWVASGVLLAGTPMTAFMAGSVNPNGVEILSGVAFALGVTGLIDHWRSAPETVRVRDALLAVVPGAYLALARPSSYVLLAALLAVLGWYALPDLWAMLRRRSALVMAPAAVLVSAVVVAYVYARATAAEPLPMTTPSVTVRQALTTTLRMADGWVYETVGIFGWREHAPSLELQVAWIALTAALVVAAWFAGAWRQRLALLSLVLGATIVGPFFVFVTLFRDGIGYQARYGMALTQAIPVLAAAVVTARSAPVPPGSLARRVLASLPLATLGLGLLAFLGSMLRYAVGLPLPTNPLKTLHDIAWLPTAWPLCLALLGLAMWTSLRIRTLILAQGDALERC